MNLTKDEEAMLNGEHGNAKKKSMEILVALGKIFGAERLIPVKSVQVAGVSYSNLGEPGLEYLSELAKDGKVEVLTTLNPAGMDLKNWEELGFAPEFAEKQKRVINAFTAMGIQATCTCTPYLIGNKPKLGEHIAWSESSAVTYANSMLGARTNREGGPSALAAALTGKTPEYGLHLDENRKPHIHFKVEVKLEKLSDYGALGYAIGQKCENKIAYISGVEKPSVDELKTLCASIVTYGAQPIFHMEGVTPETTNYELPTTNYTITEADIKEAYEALTDEGTDVDFVSIGCPHASIEEIEKVAELLEGKQVKVDTWIATARPIKVEADKLGFSKTIEDAGAKFSCDTCMAVAPLKGRFKTCATTSAKACYYARNKNAMKMRIGSLEQCIDAAVSGEWR
ncbi:MAG: aconitase X catalytic domain-containing protein [archaeon]